MFIFGLPLLVKPVEAHKWGIQADMALREGGASASKGEISQGSDSDPISFATGHGDQQIINMVRTALETKRLALAFQPIVLAKPPNKSPFMKG
jgi:hypothetical protein